MAQRDDARTDRANQRFIRQTMREPMLERERELELARRWREEGNETALHELTRAYARLVVAIAARFRHYGLPLADLIQEGNVGLMQAASRFDPARDVRFSTYAAWWIRSAVQEFVLRNWSIVRTGTTSAQKALFFNLRRLRAQIGGDTTALDSAATDRIAEALSVGVADVQAMALRLSAPDSSLNVPIGEEGDAQRQDMLVDERPSPEQVVLGMRDAGTRSRWLAEALAELSPRERTIVARRRLREEVATLEEIGRDLGVSKERVRQLEQRALTKLRRSLGRRVEHSEDLLVE